MDSTQQMNAVRDASFLTSRDCIENLIRLNIKKQTSDQNESSSRESNSTLVPPPSQLTQTNNINNLEQSSTLNTIRDNNESKSSIRLEDSFMKCYELNAKFNPIQLAETIESKTPIYSKKYKPEPNEIYSHVETSTDESDFIEGSSNIISRYNSSSSSGESSTITSRSSSSTNQTSSTFSSSSSPACSSTLSSSMVDLIEAKKVKKNSISVDDTLERNIGCYNIQHITHEEGSKSPATNKIDRLRKILQEERNILQISRRKSCTVESPDTKFSFTNKVFENTVNDQIGDNLDIERNKSTESLTCTKKSRIFSEENLSEDYNYPNNKEIFIGNEEEFSSSATGSKNVRFADDVSYI